MTSVIHANTGNIKTPSLSTHAILALDDHNFGFVGTTQPPRSPQTRRTGTENDNTWLAHGVAALFWGAMVIFIRASSSGQAAFSWNTIGSLRS